MADMAPNGASIATSFDHDNINKQLEEMDSMHQHITNLARRNSSQVDALKRPDYDPQLSQAFLEERQETFSPSKRVVGDFQSSLQQSTTRCPGMERKPTNILDMPDEILVMIFSYVKDCEHKYGEATLNECTTGACGVKNVRLTCQRFCSMSSHLLLHRLSVELDPSSLSRFEEISRHPTISKGVRGVQVLLHFYASDLANDISHFAEHYGRQLRYKVEDMEKMASAAGDTSMMILKIFQKVDAILNSWESYFADAADNPVCEDELSYQMLLQEAHEEYRQRFAAQERLRHNGTFIQAVATAMARMPFVKTLQLYDQDLYAWLQGPRYLRQLLDDNNALFRLLLLRCRWDEVGTYGLGQPPSEVLLKLPGAIHKSGVLLTSLEIAIAPPQDLAIFAPTEEDYRDLMAVAQNLKIFEFHQNIVTRGFNAYLRDGPARDADQVEPVRRFLTALIDTDSIERLSIDLLASKDLMSPPSFSFGSIITLRPWKKLYHLRLCGFPLHLAELELCIERLDKPIPEMSIQAMYLLDGSWAEGLDILQGKSTEATSFKIPYGAECNEMSYNEENAIFVGPDRNDDSPAEKYLKGKVKYNPLRDWGKEVDS